MGSQQFCLVKILITLRQLKSHRVHLSRFHFDFAITLQRQDMTTALPVVGNKVQVVAMNTNTLQIVRLSKAYQGTADVLKGK